MSNCKHAAERVVTLSAPPLVQHSLLQRLNEPMIMPSKTSLFRARSAIEKAFALSMRPILSPVGRPAPVWWLWGDSSVMGGTDWMLTHIHFCTATEPKHWVRLAACHLELCRRNAAFDFDNLEFNAYDESDGDDDDAAMQPHGIDQATSGFSLGQLHAYDDDDFAESSANESDHVEDVRAQRIEKQPRDMSISALTRVVHGFVDRHQMNPEGLGARAASLPHKVSCAVGSMSFETHGLNGCKEFIKSGISGTFDLGTEQAIGDVANADAGISSHFSKHIQPPQIKSDDGEVGADFEPEHPSVESQHFLFERMVSVSALLRILDNASKDIHEKLTSWAAFLIHLRAIMSLLCSERPRQALLHRNVKQGGYHHHAVFLRRHLSNTATTDGIVFC